MSGRSPVETEIIVRKPFCYPVGVGGWYGTRDTVFFYRIGRYSVIAALVPYLEPSLIDNPLRIGPSVRPPWATEALGWVGDLP